MPVAQAGEEVADGGAEGVCQGVPGGQAADGAALFDLDEGAPAQASALCELVVGPAALGPTSRQLQAQ